MSYLIHACPEREWYVEQFLVPALLKGGADPKEIIVSMDYERKGNLFSFMDSLIVRSEIPGEIGLWHLQDDVLPCHDFYERTKACSKSNICCGFVNEHFGPDKTKIGEVDGKDMWNSFQCIYIPYSYASECYHWFYETALKIERFEPWVASRKWDDWFFKLYINAFHSRDKVYNLKPNLVEHIDYLIGGSSINGVRTYIPRAEYFEDQDLVEDLELELMILNESKEEKS